jgi:hypothetical protein
MAQSEPITPDNWEFNSIIIWSQLLMQDLGAMCGTAIVSLSGMTWNNCATGDQLSVDRWMN